MQYLCKIGVAAVVITGIGLWSCRHCVGGEEEAAKTTPGSISGSVVDPDGQPAAGAKVWLLSTRVMDITVQTLAETTADEKGQFRLAPVKTDGASTGLRAVVLTARNSRKQIGGIFISQDIQNIPSGTDLKITLVKVKEYIGRLVDAAGRPIGKAKVTPLQWMNQNPRVNFIFMPDELQSDLTTTSAADGSFTLPNLPEEGHLVAQIETKDHGTPFARWSLQKPITIKLAPSGGIRGSLTGVKDLDKLQGIKVLAYGNLAGGFDPKAEINIYGLKKGAIQKDGSFQFKNLPPGRYQLMSAFPDEIRYYVESAEPVEVKSGETAAVTLALKPAVKVQGAVVDQKTGKGVPGVRVQFIFIAGSRNAPVPLIKSATTEASGKFTIYGRTGNAFVGFTSIPDPYFGSLDPNENRVEITHDVTLPPFPLERAINLEGIVVDVSGSPVAGAEIRYGDSSKILHSDAAGKFTLEKVKPKVSLNLLARTDKLATVPITVTPAELKGPVRLVLSEKTTFALRGTAVDDDGRPLSEAEISLGMPRYFYYSYKLLKIGNLKPDAEGRFTFGGLWPKKTYHLLVKADGHESIGENIHETEAKAGAVHDFGKIVLRGSQGVVEGRVVDVKGKPVAGARVFNSGDGAAARETRSDDDGRFRLSGFFKGPVYVFAEKEGFQFAGAPARCGATDAVLTMLPNNEPAPSRPVKSLAMPYEEQKQLARKLLEKLWAAAEKNPKPPQERPTGRTSIIEEEELPLTGTVAPAPADSEKPDLRRQIQAAMARLDPELAAKWAKELGAAPREDASDSIEKVAEADLEEALSLLAEKEENAYEALQRLARHFADSDKEKALRCAEEAIVRVRSLDQPDRAVELAQMGELVAELGNKEAGKKLTGQAADMAAKWPTTGRSQYVLERLIRSVASCDVPRAEGLLEKVADKSDREKLRMEIAITAGDIEKLESLLKEQDADTARQARRRLALQIAADRPAEAVRVAESIPEDEGENKCSALVEVASAVAPHDAALARSLITRIVAKYFQSCGKPVGSDGDRALEMAKLAVLAQEVGYPDVEGMIYRVLALRPTVGESENPESVRSATIDIAKILALVAPESAKQILELNPSKSSPWLTALALADPRQAMQQADQMLASAKDPEAKVGVPSFLLSLAELWATPPAKRLEYLSPHYPDYNGVALPAAIYRP